MFTQVTKLLATLVMAFTVITMVNFSWAQDYTGAVDCCTMAGTAISGACIRPALPATIYDASVYNREVIYHNKNLTNIFTAFASTSWAHLRPSGTGHSSGAFTALCHDSNNNIRKRYYNGSYWQGGSEGTVIASNSLDASVSIANPPGAVAKAVWRNKRKRAIHFDCWTLRRFEQKRCR